MINKFLTAILIAVVLASAIYYRNAKGLTAGVKTLNTLEFFSRK